MGPTMSTTLAPRLSKLHMRVNLFLASFERLLKRRLFV